MACDPNDAEFDARLAALADQIAAEAVPEGILTRARDLMDALKARQAAGPDETGPADPQDDPVS